MPRSKLRRKIAWEAARLIFLRVESQYFRAKMRAARSVHPGTIRAEDLPENTEIRAQIRAISRQNQEDVDRERLGAMRQQAYKLMLAIRPFQPRLVGAAVTGQLGSTPVIELLAFANQDEPLWKCLEAAQIRHVMVEPGPEKADPRRPLHQALLDGPFPCRLTVYPARQATPVAHRSTQTQKSPHATLGQLRQLIERESPELLAPQPLVTDDFIEVDRFAHYETLLLPLEAVKQPRQAHPEGDALYHSLQVFDLAKDETPYDEEFLLAALLHDVGKGIDQRDPHEASLQCLTGWVPPRTLWLIEFLPQAHLVAERKIGLRAHRRLQAEPDFDALMTLQRCDVDGRQVGVLVPDVREAIAYLKELVELCGE